MGAGTLFTPYNKFEELLHAIARNVIVDRVFEDLRHPRNIWGRENTAGVVCKFSDDGFSGIETNIDEIFQSMIALFDMSVRTSPGASSYTTLGIEWLVRFNAISVTNYIQDGQDFMIRGTANSKIMASILQKPSE
jgi:hypothetical protein